MTCGENLITKITGIYLDRDLSVGRKTMLEITMLKKPEETADTNDAFNW